MIETEENFKNQVIHIPFRFVDNYPSKIHPNRAMPEQKQKQEKHPSSPIAPKEKRSARYLHSF